jgi:hypothetical protein
VRFNYALHRWEFIFTSTAGRPVSIIYGWDRNPLTGATLEPDPVTGLLPFRDLTPDAQAEIIRIGDATNMARDARDWRDYMHQRSRYNRELRKKSAAERADDFAYMIQQVDLRRPWMKHHKRQAKGTGRLFLPASPAERSQPAAIEIVSR